MRTWRARNSFASEVQNTQLWLARRTEDFERAHSLTCDAADVIVARGFSLATVRLLRTANRREAFAIESLRQEQELLERLRTLYKDAILRDEKAHAAERECRKRRFRKVLRNLLA